MTDYITIVTIKNNMANNMNNTNITITNVKSNNNNNGYTNDSKAILIF